MLPFDDAALHDHRRLVARMAGGDAGALRELHELHVGRIHDVVVRILHDREEAREAVQDAFVKAWRRAATYRPDRGEVVSWLLFIARHTAIDRLRAGLRRRETMATLADEATGPAAAATADRESLDRQLAGLAPAQRQALELAFFSGCSQAEIALRMQVPVSSVKNHLHRGLLNCVNPTPAMNEDFTAEALAYLLDELDDGPRAQFEARLVRDPAAAADLKSLADSLAGYALSESPACPLAAEERRQMAAATIAVATQGVENRRSAGSRRYFWPAAAAVLLALNIGQWMVHAGKRASTIPGGKTAAAPAGAELAGADPGATHALAVDLVDGGDRNDREKRSSLVYVEPATLTKPGVAAAGFGPGSSAVTASFSQSVTVARSGPDSPHPYAWSAFDPSRHQGFLDLHNLPTIPADRSLQLWVRPVGSNLFEKVGEIPPQFYGRSGSITYKLPSANVTPAQILVTVEPRLPIPTVPTGPVVLHGP